MAKGGQAAPALRNMAIDTVKYPSAKFRRFGITDRKSLRRGLFMALLVLVALWLYIGLPYAGKTAMRFSEDFFNSLSKGSAGSGEDLFAKAQSFRHVSVDLNLNLDLSLGVAPETAGIFALDPGEVTLAELATAAINDAQLLYHNRHEELAGRYNTEPRRVIYAWWSLFSGLEREYLRQGSTAEASFLGEIRTRVLEPAYNYYGIHPDEVKQNIGTVVLLLLLYLAFTFWWGYAVYFLLKGIGMIKPEVPGGARLATAKHTQ